MSLAQSRSPVNIEGIVGFSRGFRHRKGRRVGKLIAVADHEGVEGILHIEVGLGAILLQRLHGSGLLRLEGAGLLGKDKLQLVFLAGKFCDGNLQWERVFF